jgi:hypothetical protein
MDPMDSRKYRTIAVVPIALAAIAYAMWWHPKPFEGFEREQVYILLSCWWTSLLGGLAAIFLARRAGESIWPFTVATAAILFPPAETVLVFTIWSVRGFAP